MNNARVLLLIAAFLALTIGSFIWYVATWDQRPTGQFLSTPTERMTT